MKVGINGLNTWQNTSRHTLFSKSFQDKSKLYVQKSIRQILKNKNKRKYDAFKTDEKLIEIDRTRIKEHTENAELL